MVKESPSMAVSQETLREYAQREPLQKSATIVEEARTQGKQTAFLCHSHKDAALAKGVQRWLQSQGWEVYIDWDDHSMPDRPTKETAGKIKLQIQRLDWLLFLATANSMSSRWCPWEIGYADGKKGAETVVIIPTTAGGDTYGNEYLDLYRNVFKIKEGGFAMFEAGASSDGRLLRAVRRP
jgi:hypothetical protein